MENLSFDSILAECSTKIDLTFGADGVECGVDELNQINKMNLSELSNFTGTEGYTRHRFIPNSTGVLLTDGVKYLAENAGAYWLMDIILSILPQIRNEEFWTVKLKVKNNKGQVTIDDGNNNVLYTQRVHFCDFPEPGIKLFVSDNRDYGEEPVIMLPSEY